MTELHPLLSAMLGELPEAGPWPVDQRKRWMTAFGAVLDLVYQDVAAPKGVVTVEVGGTLSGNQQHVLDFLRSNDKGGEWFDMGVKQIAQGSGVPLGTVPSVLDRLVQIGLLHRDKNAETGGLRFRIPGGVA